MKRSFYEMLGVPHDADQARIDAAYALVTAKLEASTNLRGASEAVSEMKLIREGYRILSDPASRARYDGKLAADAAGVKLMFFPEDSGSRRKLGVETVVFAVLAAVFGGVVYWQLSREMEVVRVEHVQAVAKQREGQNKPVTVNATRPDAASTKAGGQEQKR